MFHEIYLKPAHVTFLLDIQLFSGYQAPLKGFDHQGYAMSP